MWREKEMVPERRSPEVLDSEVHERTHQPGRGELVRGHLGDDLFF